MKLRMVDPKEENIFTQSVNEADIDWLFCVELNTSQEFRKFIAKRLFQELQEFTHIRAYRSIIRKDRRESDLLWCINTPGHGDIIGLIENKINASAQREQYRDYESCGKSYIEKGYCQKYAVALLSPKGYPDTEKYPIRIYYEDIVNWLNDRPDERSRYLAGIYKKAIKKLSDPVEFWNKYKEYPSDSDNKSVNILREALIQYGYAEKYEGSLQFRLPDVNGYIIIAIWNNGKMEIYFEQPKRSLREELIKKYVNLDKVQKYIPKKKDQYLFISQNDWKEHINEFLAVFNRITKEIRDN